jgi:sigma-B regulation protein RsbU (phosphoserine phosphatase)
MTEQLFDKAPCGYFAFFDEGTLYEFNHTLGTILKYDADQLKGRNVETIFTLPTRIFFQTHLFPLVRLHGHAEEIFLSLLTSDGEHLPVLLNAHRVQLEQRMVTCCVFIIVPNRKRFEEELVAARNRAEKALLENTELLKVKADLQLQAEKLDQQMLQLNRQNDELKQFSHVVTHNLKEPLRKILLFAGKLKAENYSGTVERLVKSTDQMKAVITGLQQYVWLNEKLNQFKKINLNDIVHHAENILKDEMDADTLHLEYKNLVSLDADEEQLQLLIYHLLSNAVKFRKGGKVNVAISSTILKQNKFRSVEGKYKYDDFVKLEVKDDGIGFEPVFKEYIFELFRKLDLTSGQGLGLSLCKKIADNHNGFIEAESEHHSFTKITVWLPLRQSAQADQKDQDSG